jgi:hypothetical protein
MARVPFSVLFSSVSRVGRLALAQQILAFGVWRVDFLLFFFFEYSSALLRIIIACDRVNLPAVSSTSFKLKTSIQFFRRLKTPQAS